MNYLVKDQDLTLEYHPGQGAWTYRVVIPNSRDIPGTWKHLKVSGTLDDYVLTARNLAPRRGLDKMLSINADIRRHTGKQTGDTLRATLYLEPNGLLRDPAELLACLEDAGVLPQFEALGAEAQKALLHSILVLADETRQEQKLLVALEALAALPQQ